MSTPPELAIIDPAWIPLADGSRLCARIWLPASAEAEPVPAILEYLPYRKDDVTAAEDARMHPYFAAHGYAAVRVDIRGSGDSDGVLVDEYSAAEHADALEVIAWLAAQPWCTGAVGMMGISWSGFNSLQVAARRPPALKAIITACSTDDRYDNDVHYLGGVPLGYYLLPWASALMSFNARPPDPAMVGERWRELWHQRLDGNVDLIALWLSHQARDGYWRHGSICEDYGAVEVPVFALSGWADAYVDAVLRMLGGLSGPRLGLIGPWGHQWPQDGHPGPAIGFLQEAVRWWDHWLKGIDTGIMDEPRLRAWMQEGVAPAPDYAERPGRWIAEPGWPTASTETVWLELGVGGLHAPGPASAPGAGAMSTADPAPGSGATLPADPTPGTGAADRAALVHCSPQTVGIEAGAWCGYGRPADAPTDQRRDDALSLTLDGPVLTERLEIFGQPELVLSVASDRPSAFVVARLCDVAPDGASTLITRGVLNLCHHAGHGTPQPLVPGELVHARVPLKATAYALAPGHRLRLAISTSYWPWLWPSPEPATVTIATGGASVLSLPVRTGAGADDRLHAFGPPVHAPELAVTRLRGPAAEYTFTEDVARQTVSLRMRRDFIGAQELPSGLRYIDYDPSTLTITEGDPLSARVECERRILIERGDWRTRIELRSQMTADAEHYRVNTVIEAFEGDERIHTRSFDARIPRNHS